MKTFGNLGLILSSRMSKFILIGQVVISAFVTVNIITRDIGAEAFGPVSISIEKQPKNLAILSGNSLVSISNPMAPVAISSFADKYTVSRRVNMTLTAYTSTPEETDDTPFITASGKMVADGIVANNGLPFGTKVKIPDIYGDKVFIVQDRMNYRMGTQRMDIWFSEKGAAIKFGVKNAKIEVLED